MKSIIEAFARNTVFANILLFTVILAGILASASMIREELPNMEVDMVLVTIAWPGATPEDVEEGVSRKIEEAIEGVEGIDTYTTYSTEGLCNTVIEISYGYNKEVVLDRVQNKVDEISTFPEDSEIPIVKIPEKRFSVMTLSLTGDLDEAVMKEWAEDVRDEITRLPEVSQVEISGTREYEISIEVTEETLRRYGLSLSDVASAIRTSSLNLSGGSVKTKTEELTVRTVGRKYTGKELSGVVVLADSGGGTVTLGQIADIRDGFVEDDLSYQVSGKKAVFVNIFKTEKEDAITIANAVKTYVDTLRSTLPDGNDVKILSDETVKIRSNISLLIKNGLMGLVLVFICLWFFLDTKLAFWAGMGIPISIVGGISILWATGQTLNMVTLFGLIMVLGIVADDAIIVGEAIFVHRQNGASPVMAAVNGLSEVGMPVVAAILTTIVAFIPLMNIGGVLGEIIKCLPIAVIACLLISLLECYILLPAHLSDLPDPNTKMSPENGISERVRRFHQKSIKSMDVISRRLYKPFLTRLIRYRYLTVSAAIALFLMTVGLIAGDLVKYDMFPDRDGNVIIAEVEFPEGTPYQVTERAVESIRQGLDRLVRKSATRSGDSLVVDTLVVIGQGPGDEMAESGDTGSNIGGVKVVLLDSESRGIHTRDLVVDWQKETGTIAGVKRLSFTSAAKGPPGAPVEVCFEGKNPDSITAASELAMEYLNRIEGVFQVESDNAPGKNEISFSLKPEARNLGITVNDLASQVYAGYYGEEAVKIQRGDDEIKVMVRFSESERQRLSSLDDFRVRSSAGHEVPLNAVAEIHYGPGYSKITRSDGLRQIMVSAEVDTKTIVAGEVLDELTSGLFGKIREQYPDVGIVLKGDAKKDRETFGSLLIWFPLAILAIYMIVATMFRSYIQPFIILFSIPFGLIGAVLGHFVMGQALSLFSVFGMVALTGVVVNDAIVLIDRINENMADKYGFIESVINGGERRFRAVMLTSITTIGGLLPLIMETSTYAQMLIPMAISLAAGVAFATLLTLILIPGLMVILNDVRRLVRWLSTGVRETREAVEPAYRRRDTDDEMSRMREALYTQPLAGDN